MNRFNKIVSAIVLVSFLLNTAVSDLALGQNLNLNHDKLGAASKFDNITGGVDMELARIEFLLTLQLKEVGGTLAMPKAAELPVDLAMLKENADSFSDYVTYRNQFGGKHSLDTPFKDRVHFLFDNTLRHLTDSVCVVTCYVGKNKYYAIFSTTLNEFGEYPVAVYTANEYEAQASYIAELRDRPINVIYVEELPTRDFAAASEPAAKLVDADVIRDLKIMNRILEKDTINMITKAGSGHPGGSLSMLNMVTALFFGRTKGGKRLMNVDPKNPSWVNRDRFVLSKGHAAPGLYAALGRIGFFFVSVFDTLRQLGSILQGHTDMTKTPGVDMSGGPLGVGISAAVGMALAAKMDGRDYTTYVMLGDAETEEGQVDEAGRHAAAMGLDNMVAFVDCNGMGIDEKVTQVDVGYEGQIQLWKARGWNVIEADGGDMASVTSAIIEAKTKKNGKPTAIIAKTQKGAGLPGMEKHGSMPSEADVNAAMNIIDKDLTALGGEDFDADTYVKSVVDKTALTKGEIDNINKVNEEAAKARKAELAKITESENAVKIIDAVKASYPKDKNVSTRAANGDELALLGAEDTDVVLLSADLKGSVMFDKFANAFGTFSAANPTGRYIPAGIREAHMISMAVGLATCGKIPVVGTFSIFTTRMVDQLNAILNNKKLPIIIVGTHGGLATGPDGRTHEDAHSLAVLGALPNVHLYEGADAEETRVLAKHIYETAKKTGGIHYIRPARLDTPIIDKPEGWQEGAKKGFYVLYDSATVNVVYDVVIITSGVVAADAVAAAKELAAKGKNVRVINVTQLKEINSEKNLRDFARLIRNCSNIVSVIDALPEILGNRINDVLVKERIIPGFVKALGIKDYGESGKPAELYAKHGFDKAGILKTARLLMGNGIEKLVAKGQSVWADGAFTPEEIAFFIRKGITGQTTNLTIINNAIKAHMFDDIIRAGIEKGLSAEKIYDEVCISYIRSMAESWKEVYDKTGHKDGYVSIEVNPDYADDVEKTVAEAERLVKAIGMPNVMVKIPATPAGIKAIEELTYRGIHVNVTLLFGIANCMEAKKARDRGLARRKAEGKPIDNIHSVLSFFVSRVNCKPGACDEQLRKLIEHSKDAKLYELSNLIGKAAIANTILAYKMWYDSENGSPIRGISADQRLLWASTQAKKDETYFDGTKFSPLAYVVNLPIDNTVNTMPKETLEATIMAENIEPEVRNKMSVEEAQGVMDALKAAGINIDKVTEALQKDGVASFAKDYADSLTLIREHIAKLGVAAPAAAPSVTHAAAMPPKNIHLSPDSAEGSIPGSAERSAPEPAAKPLSAAAEEAMEIIARSNFLQEKLNSPLGLSLNHLAYLPPSSVNRETLEELVNAGLEEHRGLEVGYRFTPAGEEKIKTILAAISTAAAAAKREATFESLSKDAQNAMEALARSKFIAHCIEVDKRFTLDSMREDRLNISRKTLDELVARKLLQDVAGGNFQLKAYKFTEAGQRMADDIRGKPAASAFAGIVKPQEASADKSAADERTTAPFEESVRTPSVAEKSKALKLFSMTTEILQGLQSRATVADFEAAVEKVDNKAVLKDLLEKLKVSRDIDFKYACQEDFQGVRPYLYAQAFIKVVVKRLRVLGEDMVIRSVGVNHRLTPFAINPKLYLLLLHTPGYITLRDYKRIVPAELLYGTSHRRVLLWMVKVRLLKREGLLMKRYKLTEEGLKVIRSIREEDAKEIMFNLLVTQLKKKVLSVADLANMVDKGLITKDVAAKAMEKAHVKAPATTTGPVVAETKPALISETMLDLVRKAVEQVRQVYGEFAHINDFINELKLDSMKGWECKDEHTGFVFSPWAAFGYEEKGKLQPGLGPLLKIWAQSGIPIAVITENEDQDELIVELNRDIPKEKWIGHGANLDAIKPAFVKRDIARYYYFKTSDEKVIDGVKGFRDIVVRHIIETIGSVRGIIGRELENLRRGMLEFAQAA